MYENILVPIDPAHIDAAVPTVELAEHLKSDNGKITLFTVVEDIPAYVLAEIPDFSLESTRKSTEDELSKFIEQQNLDAIVEAKIGHAATSIQEYQQDNNCDLIIISSHKPTTVDLFLGSTASKIVRRAQCPVFVTR